MPGAVQAATPDALLIAHGKLLEALRFLRDDADFDLVFLSNLTGVDRESHLEVVYHLQSLDRNHLLCCKSIAVNREDPQLPSLISIYHGALLQEREVFDLFGIRFEGHPDLRRMFLWDGFPGYPLRKDFMGMPGGLRAGLPGFPHEPGYNAWPVPGSVPATGGIPKPGGAPELRDQVRDSVEGR